MTSPLPVPAELEQPAPTRRYHKYCATEAIRAQQGRVREALCGRVMSGPRRPRDPGVPICAMCEDLVGPHRAGCADCQAVWGKS